MFAYRRRWQGHELIMAANFHGHDTEWTGAEVPDLEGFKRILGNYADAPHVRAADGATATASPVSNLRPYETSVWYR